MKHSRALAIPMLIVAAVYAKLTGAYFCGFDDFREANRAMFQPAHGAMSVLTSTWYDPFTYRPVGLWMQHLMLQVFGFDPLAFRIRNLVMLLVCMAAFYGIVYILTRSRMIAAGAALIFGVDPLANQAVAVALWNNATAWAMALTSLWLFLWSYAPRTRETRAGPILLVASLALLFITAFVYEPVIAYLPLMWLYAALVAPERERLAPFYSRALSAGSVVMLLAFFTIRHVVIRHGAPLVSPGTMAHNALLYLLALATPVDPFYLHRIAGTPLPSDVHITKTMLAAASAVLLAGCAVGAMYDKGLRAIRERLSGTDRGVVLFLAGAIVLSCLPLLVFKAHASEQNLFAAAGFYAALCCVVLARIVRFKIAYGVVIAAVAVSFALATWARGADVIRCGTVAQRIFTTLPMRTWRSGVWQIRLANAPQSRLRPTYGVYGLSGLQTIQSYGNPIPGAQYAIQLLTSNERVAVKVVSTRTLQSGCPSARACFFVTPAGEVRRVDP